MTRNPTEYIRADILALEPYSSARDEFDGEAAVFLDANENALDPLGKQVHRYPHPGYQELKEAISRWRNVAPERIFVGNGSDEAIDLLIRAACFPGRDEIMVLPPTYGMYAVQARIQGVHVQSVVLTEEFQPDVGAILNASTDATRILFLCSPNNPTGNILAPERVEALLRQFRGLVVVDEAYIDFAEEPGWLPRLEEFPNLVVLQTFSKAIGLAGIRLGMAFGHQDVIPVRNKIKFPYNLNRLTVKVALEALEDRTALEDGIRQIVHERERLATALRRIPGVERVFPSQANFLLVQFADAEAVFRYLQRRGVIVRDRSRLPRCHGCLRITVGKPEENDYLLTLLQEMKHVT